VITNIPNSAGMQATHPEMSPDGLRLANVETNNVVYDFQVNNGSIVTRTFDQTSNSFGAIQTLVADAPGASNYYPSWSPDSQWISFTRTVGNSYSDGSATAWVVKADGSLPPIQLTLANSTGNLTTSWNRWTPFASSFGPDREPVLYLTLDDARVRRSADRDHQI
jgi:Tol biopolymer transport system component